MSTFRIRPARVALAAMAAFSVWCVLIAPPAPLAPLWEFCALALVAGGALGACTQRERLDAYALGAALLLPLWWLAGRPVTRLSAISLIGAGVLLVLWAGVRLVGRWASADEQRLADRRRRLASWADVYADEHRQR